MTAAGVDAGAVEDRVGEALAGADWTAALDLLRTAREQRALSLPELDALARAAYGAGEFELAITSWEQAYAGYQELGDEAGAASAAVTVAVYLLIDTGLMAPIRGWLGRAERLLEGRPESPAHALAAMVHAYERFSAATPTAPAAGRGRRSTSAPASGSRWPPPWAGWRPPG